MLLRLVVLTLGFAGIASGSLPAADLVPRYEVVVKSGDAVIIGSTFTSFGQTSLMSDARVVAVVAKIAGEGVTPGNDTVIWESGHRHVVAQEGGELSVGGGASRYVSEIEVIRLGPDSSVQFLARVSETPGGAAGSRAFFPGNFSPIVEGQQVDYQFPTTPPESPEGPTICEEIIGFSAMVNSSSWTLAGRFSGPGLTSSTDEAIVDGNRVIMREGDVVPGTEETYFDVGATYASSAPGNIASVRLSPSLTGGLWQTGVGTPYRRFLSTYAPLGEPAGTKIADVRTPTGNANHDVVFLGDLQPPDGASQPALFHIRGGDDSLPLPIVRAGDRIPDGNAVFKSFSSPAAGLKKGGWGAVFEAQLEGDGVTESSDRALYAIETDGTLHKLLREGDGIPIADGDVRTVSTFFYSAWSLNALDQVSLSVGFTDGTSAVVIVDLVEPPPVPTPLTLTLKGFPNAPTARKTVKSAALVVTGSTTGDARRIEWKRLGDATSRFVRADRPWRIRLALKTGQNRFALRAVDAAGKSTAWKQLMIRRLPAGRR